MPALAVEAAKIRNNGNRLPRRGCFLFLEISVHLPTCEPDLSSYGLVSCRASGNGGRSFVKKIETMKKIGLLSLLCSCLVVTSCTRNQKEVNISGAFALYPLTLLWTEDFQEANPGLVINVSGGGAGKGMTDVLNDMVDFGMISREIKVSKRSALGFYPIVRDEYNP